MSTTKTELLKTIRKKCLDCVCFQAKEVELCPGNDCPLWPYRFAKDPFKTPLTEKQKEQLNAARAKSPIAHSSKSMCGYTVFEKEIRA